MQRACPGVLIQHYMNSFGSGLNATDVQSQVKDPPPSFNFISSWFSQRVHWAICGAKLNFE